MLRKDDSSGGRLFLIVTSSDRHSAYLRSVLEAEGHDVRVSPNLAEVESYFTDSQADVLIIDTEMRDGDAVTVAQRLNYNPRLSELYILFLMPLSPEIPPWLARFREKSVHIITYPYGQGEVKAQVAALSNRISS